MGSPHHRIVYFGVFEADFRAGELRKEGLKIRLPNQSLQILQQLVERSGDVVTREELRQKLWPGDTFVDFEAGLNNAIKKLRDALGDSAESPRFVQTLPRHGYRFIAPVEETAALHPREAIAEARAKFPSGVRWRWVGSGAAVVAALAVLLALNAGGWRQRLFRSLGIEAAPVQIKSLAVLPLENLTGDPGQEYFVDGMSEALTTNLAQIRSLRVISRTSAMQYKRAKKVLPQIARELKVDAVVEGAVARSGDRVRITAQLIHAPTDRHLWAQSYERELRDVLILQGELAQAIARAIQVELQPGTQRRLARARPVHPEAYEAYLKGRFYWSKRGPENLLKAVEYFQQAIGKDPTYAPAFSGLSDTYRLFDFVGLAPPRESMPKAETAARKALALDDTLAEAHASLAGVLFRYHWDWAGAEKQFQRSLELDPNRAEGHRAYAIYLTSLGRHTEAAAEAQRARELDPLSVVILSEAGLALLRLGRTEEAIQQLQKTLEIDANYPSAYLGLADAYRRKGDRPQAVAALEKAAALARGWPHLQWLGYGYAVTGQKRQAQKVLAEMEKLSQQQYVSPQSFATVHLGLGNKEQTLAWLEKAYEERSLLLAFSTEHFDPLRDEPRFQALLRRMGLPPGKAASLSAPEKRVPP